VPQPPLEPPSLAAVRAAARRLRGLAVRTPLVRLNVDAPAEIWLKLETLQPVGSFKIRGAGNAMAGLTPAERARGVVTASAGNMAQGVAWCARVAGVPCTVVVPDHAPPVKVAAVERLGARVVRRPFEAWWRALEERRVEGVEGTFIHPVSDPAVVAGNGTLGIEIAEDLPGVDAVAVPFGGGGLATGVAAALRELAPACRVWAAEPETAAPLAASLAAGRPEAVAYRASFVDGAGGRAVLPAMWPAVQGLVAGARVVSLPQAAAAIRTLVERARVVAEGAAALPVAAALAGLVPGERVVCVVSGGNIDAARLVAALEGRVPD
jgi:threonine dehydratase